MYTITFIDNVFLLINVKLLVELDKDNNSIGKKRTLLDVNPNLFHFIIVALTGNEFILNIYNLKDEIPFSQTLLIPNKNNIKNLLENYIIKFSSFKLVTTIFYNCKLLKGSLYKCVD